MSKKSNQYPDSEITVNGKHYRHDYESDIYYRCDPQPVETLRQTVLKCLFAIAVLATIIYFFGNF